MFINDFTLKVKAFLISIFFPITICVISLLIWVTPSPFNWIFISLFFILSFLPLFSKEGKTYLPLILTILISNRKELVYDNIPIELILMFTFVFISMTIFVIVYKCKFKKGDLMLPLCLLILTLFISYIYNSIENSSLSKQGILYLLYLFIALLFYILISTIIGKGESLPYLCETISFISILIILQICISYIQNGYVLYSNTSLQLGWSNNSDYPTIILLISLPLILLLVNRNKPLYLIPLFLNIIFIILLATNIGILALILSIIPIVLFAFKSYKKIYSYVSITIISLFIITFALLIACNNYFNERILTAIKCLMFFQEGDSNLNSLFKQASEAITSNPYVGKSITFYINNNTTEYFSSNTFLTTLVLGGGLSLCAYLYLDIKAYYYCMTKKGNEKQLFLFFLILFEFVGLLSNTIYSINILLFYLLFNSVYQMSNRIDNILVHAEYNINKKKYKKC